MYSRPKTPAPKSGWRIRELSQLSGITVRTLRSYVALGVLRPLQRRGTQTRYPRSELFRLLALIRLRLESKLGLTAIKRKLESLGEAEIERWVTSGTVPAAAAAVLGLAQQVHTPAPEPTPLGGAASPSLHTETWYHMELLPGLVLKLSSKASVAVRNAAQRIFDEHTARG